MVLRRKVVLLLLVCFVIGGGILFASEVGQSSAAFSAGFCNQNILYNENSTVYSAMGPGIRADYFYRFDDRFSFGVDVFAGYFKYQDFHSFFDLRGFLDMRIHLLDKETSNGGSFNISTTFGGGAAVSIREDTKAGSFGVMKALLHSRVKQAQSLSWLPRHSLQYLCRNKL